MYQQAGDLSAQRFDSAWYISHSGCERAGASGRSGWNEGRLYGPACEVGRLLVTALRLQWRQVGIENSTLTFPQIY
jgi:hypothetical protein